MTERLNNNNKKLGTRKVEYLDYIRKKFPYVKSHITFKRKWQTGKIFATQDTELVLISKIFYKSVTKVTT